MANGTDETYYRQLAAQKNIDELESALKLEKWYGTTGDMEHLLRFWKLNFNKTPDFRPNYIIPNSNSIVRCITGGKGLAIIPDFLCKKEIENASIKLIWEGTTPLTNIIYFGCRKNTSHLEEINLIKTLFKSTMATS